MENSEKTLEKCFVTPVENKIILVPRRNLLPEPDNVLREYAEKALEQGDFKGAAELYQRSAQEEEEYIKSISHKIGALSRNKTGLNENPELGCILDKLNIVLKDGIGDQLQYDSTPNSPVFHRGTDSCTR